MPKLYVARRTNRLGLYLPMAGTRQNPNLMFFLPKTSGNQLEDLVRSQLSKQGITDEAAVNKVVEQAEQEYEQRLKVQEAEREVRRLMTLRAQGAKLIQVGFRKWKQAFFMSPIGR